MRREEILKLIKTQRSRSKRGRDSAKQLLFIETKLSDINY